MRVEALLQETESLGIRLLVTGDQLKAIGPATLPKEQALPLLERLREHRSEVLAILSQRPATCAASCYELEPGRWIHRPGHGCRTIPPTPAATKVESQCWHCKGLKVCRCIVCWDARTGTPGSCVTCKGTGKAWTWTH
jgi:hypothetical protein